MVKAEGIKTKSAIRNFTPRSFETRNANQRLNPTQPSARAPIIPPEGRNTSAIRRSKPKARINNGQANVLIRPPTATAKSDAINLGTESSESPGNYQKGHIPS